MLITAESPTELGDRAAALDAVARINNETLAQMGEIRAELALKEARLEVLRQQVEKQRQLAAIALEEAAISRDRAAAAKDRVDSLVAKKATALDVAATEGAAVLRQYKTMRAEQSRIAALLATRARTEAARPTSGGHRGFTPTTSGGFGWPVSGAQATGSVGPRVHPVYGYRSCHTGLDVMFRDVVWL